MQRTLVVAARWTWILVLPALACGSGTPSADVASCPDGGCVDGITFDPGLVEEVAPEVEPDRGPETAGDADDLAEAFPADVPDAEADGTQLGQMGDPCDDNTDCE